MRQHAGDFADLNTRVVVISFSRSRAYARRWLEETDCPFPLLLDPERALYRRYGLRHSVVRAWSPRTLWFYFKRIMTGRPIYGIQGDPNQLGGDFIIDAGGAIRLAHRSAESTDRPPVTFLLGILRELQAGR